MRIMGLDLGTVTCGISISDLLQMIAQPVTTIRFEHENFVEALQKLEPYLQQYKPKKIVLGLPKHMNGDVGERAQASLDFKKMLEEKSYDVVMWDERLSTVAANRILLEFDMSRKKRKKVIDQMAAVQILQGYLDQN